ncbi:MAG: precorrin-6A reductase [Methanobrevibacter sp.]|nr:precorrin-6A reductase [Methanobrevibacter sp.]
MKKINVFLMGGTKESIEVIKHLKKNYNSHILTTTTTEYGGKLAKEGGSDSTISKPLPKDDLLEVLNGKTDFDLYIDATHPFASHVTKTAIEVSKICEIPYIRFERYASNLDNYDKTNIHTVKSFEDAGKLIEKKFNQVNVLHFAGANTMKDLVKFVSVEKFYPRILEVESSFKKCEKLAIPKENIIPMKGTSTVEENLELIDKLNAGLIITKESGEIGGVDAKIKAANIKNIPIILIQRPEIKELDKKTIVHNLNELDEKIKEYLF